MNVYAYAFDSDETRAWILLGLFSSLALLTASLFGAVARALRRRAATRGSNPAAPRSPASQGDA